VLRGIDQPLSAQDARPGCVVTRKPHAHPPQASAAPDARLPLPPTHHTTQHHTQTADGNFVPVSVWTSTLQRTIHTAARLPFAKLKWKALDEIDAGICDGMTYAEVRRVWGGLRAACLRFPCSAASARRGRARARTPAAPRSIMALSHALPTHVHPRRLRTSTRPSLRRASGTSCATATRGASRTTTSCSAWSPSSARWSGRASPSSSSATRCARHARARVFCCGWGVGGCTTHALAGWRLAFRP
jgi:hypothetical protein